MATYDLTPSQTTVPASAGAASYGRRTVVAETIVDFSAPTLPAGVTAISGASGTVVRCINVPAGFIVLGSGIEVLRTDSAGNSGTLQIKVDSATQGSAVAFSSATGFLANAGTLTPVVAAGSNVYLTITVGTGAVNGIVRVYAILLDVRAKRGTPAYVGTSTNPAGQATAFGWDAFSNYSTALTFIL